MANNIDIGRKCFGIYFGTVLQHLTHGQLKVYIQGIYPEEWITQPELLPTCRQIVSQFGGSHDGNGVFSYPNIGATVVCMFANGDQNLPLMVGSLLGGQNAFGQYELIRTNEEQTSNKHLITSGHSHIEMYEDGKISAMVVAPIRTEAVVEYHATPDASLSVDAVDSRPICDKIAEDALSNINCQYVLDNTENNGTISSSTHYFCPYNVNEKTMLSAEKRVLKNLKTGQISTDSYSSIDNAGSRKFGQISSVQLTANDTTLDLVANTIETVIQRTNSSTSDKFNQSIDGTYGLQATHEIDGTYSYNFYNNATKETILSTNNNKCSYDSGILNNSDTSYQMYGIVSNTINESYKDNSTTKIKRAVEKATSKVQSTRKSKLQLAVLSSLNLNLTDNGSNITTVHKASSSIDIDSTDGILLSSNYNDDTTSNGINEKHQNKSIIDAKTSKNPSISMTSVKKMMINGNKIDVECEFDQSPTLGKVILSIIDNVSKETCKLEMDTNGRMSLTASKALEINAPSVTIKGTSLTQKFKTITTTATNITQSASGSLLLIGSSGDCKIKNVSLLNHVHRETQAGDVVSPQPTQSATASN